MGKYTIIFSQNAQEDLVKISKKGDKSQKAKIERLIGELSLHPTTGSGKPEQLKGKLSGLWSSRINGKDRLVYEIRDEIRDEVVEVHILSCLSHYGDK